MNIETRLAIWATKLEEACKAKPNCSSKLIETIAKQMRDFLEIYNSKRMESIVK